MATWSVRDGETHSMTNGMSMVTRGRLVSVAVMFIILCRWGDGKVRSDSAGQGERFNGCASALVRPRPNARCQLHREGSERTALVGDDVQPDGSAGRLVGADDLDGFTRWAGASVIIDERADSACFAGRWVAIEHGG